MMDWIPANRWLRCAGISAWLCFPYTQCELEEPLASPSPSPSPGSDTLHPPFTCQNRCLCSLPHPTVQAAHGESGEPSAEDVCNQPVIFTEDFALSVQ